MLKTLFVPVRTVNAQNVVLTALISAERVDSPSSFNGSL